MRAIESAASRVQHRVRGLECVGHVWLEHAEKRCREKLHVVTDKHNQRRWPSRLRPGPNSPSPDSQGQTAQAQMRSRQTPDAMLCVPVVPCYMVCQK